MYEDPIEAARKRMMPGTNQSFFPAVQRLFDDRSDLNNMLNQTPETAFLGPTPTPTPTPVPRANFGFQGFRPQNVSQFNFPSNFGTLPTVTPTPRPTLTPNQWQDWQARYGFSF